MYYICIITSEDYYTLYDGVEIVKANDVEDAKEKAKKQHIKKTGMNGFSNYRFIDTVILCGNKKPIIK